MKELFMEILEESSRGKIIIDDEELYIAFNCIVYENDKEVFTSIENDNYPTLIIKDYNIFIKLLEEYLKEEKKISRKIPSYIKEESKDKWILSYLFVNATPEDFKNPEEFIKRKINFLKDNTFDYLNNGIELKLPELFYNSILELKKEKNAISMETPYKITIKIRDKLSNTYDFPSIYYSIDEKGKNKTCYIYSVMVKNKKNIDEQEQKFQKKINRLLYKLNNGLASNEDYNIKGEENIKDVSMSFILAINIFMSLLQKEKIRKVKIVPYLPLRYLSRDIASNNNEELQNRNDSIQYNATNKLIRSFRRIAKQNKNISIELYPYELDEFLTIDIGENREKIENELLETTTNKVSNIGTSK